MLIAAFPLALQLVASWALVPSGLTACGADRETAPAPLDDSEGGTSGGALDPVDRYVSGPPRALSKKSAWLIDKEVRADVRVPENEVRRGFAVSRAPAPRQAGVARTTDATAARLMPVTTLFNIWTREALPLLPADDGTVETRFSRFLRDHYTNQATEMDGRLVDVLERAARKFGAERIEIVSGYRSPKYNLSLRKKGHQVARSSQHCEGHAVDFRIRGVNTRTLLQFVKSLRRGGVGFYPHSQFVHCDTGPIRYWKGT